MTDEYHWINLYSSGKRSSKSMKWIYKKKKKERRPLYYCMLFYGTRLCLVAQPYVWFVGGVWVWLLSNDVVSQIVLIFSFTEDMCVKLIHSDTVLNHHYSNRLLKNWPPCWTSSLLAVQWRKNNNFGSQKFTWDTGLRLVITWETAFKNFVPNFCKSNHFPSFFHWTTSKLDIQHDRIGCTKLYYFIRINAASLWIYFRHISSTSNEKILKM